MSIIPGALISTGLGWQAGLGMYRFLCYMVEHLGCEIYWEDDGLTTAEVLEIVRRMAEKRSSGP